MNIFKKCEFCQKKTTLFVLDYNFYSHSRKNIYYHEDCVKDALHNYKEAGHKKVDIALHVCELLEDLKKKSESDKDQEDIRVKIIKERIEKLNEIF